MRREVLDAIGSPTKSRDPFAATRSTREHRGGLMPRRCSMPPDQPVATARSQLSDPEVTNALEAQVISKALRSPHTKEVLGPVGFSAIEAAPRDEHRPMREPDAADDKPPDLPEIQSGRTTRGRTTASLRVFNGAGWPCAQQGGAEPSKLDAHRRQAALTHTPFSPCVVGSRC